jgi:hypothetical protein
MFFGGWLSFLSRLVGLSRTICLHWILIPFGYWVIYDGIRYETVFGRVILPGLGTVITVLGALFIALPAVNEFIQGPFWLLSKIFVFLFVYVWMRVQRFRAFRYDQLIGFRLEAAVAGIDSPTW